MSGFAARFVSGATRLTRPNTHATIGADAIVATVVPSSVTATARTRPVQPMHANAFAELRRRDHRRHTDDAQLIAGVEHDARIEDRLHGAHRDDRPARARSLREPVTSSVVSIVAERTAGIGAPIIAT